jgi:CheY-like chemotaxis protein
LEGDEDSVGMDAGQSPFGVGPSADIEESGSTLSAGKDRVTPRSTDAGIEILGAARPRSPWRDKPFLLLMLIFLVWNAVFIQVLTTFPLYMRSVYGLAENRIGQLMLEGLAQLLVGAFGDLGDVFQDLRVLGIKIDMEVVGEAADGSTAMEMIPRLKPELVLLDECMPGMTGSEVTRQIKNLWPHIKVILLTMYSDRKSLAIEGGVDAFLIKGIPTEHILAMIREIVEKAG